MHGWPGITDRKLSVQILSKEHRLTAIWIQEVMDLSAFTSPGNLYKKACHIKLYGFAWLLPLRIFACKEQVLEKTLRLTWCSLPSVKSCLVEVVIWKRKNVSIFPKFGYFCLDNFQFCIIIIYIVVLCVMHIHNILEVLKKLALFHYLINLHTFHNSSYQTIRMLGDLVSNLRIESLRKMCQ